MRSLISSVIPIPARPCSMLCRFLARLYQDTTIQADNDYRPDFLSLDHEPVEFTQRQRPAEALCPFGNKLKKTHPNINVPALPLAQYLTLCRANQHFLHDWPRSF